MTSFDRVYVHPSGKPYATVTVRDDGMIEMPEHLAHIALLSAGFHERAR